MDWSYIGGFFDGEGTIAHNGKGFRISIPQTNRKVLEAIRAYSGVGYIVKISKRRPHWRDCWVYYIASQEDIYLFLKCIVGMLQVKRLQAKTVIIALKPKLIVMRARRRNAKRRIEAALKFRSNGLSYRQIGKKLRVDYGYIRRVILKNS